jgi:hypothetical protein
MSECPICEVVGKLNLEKVETSEIGGRISKCFSCGWSFVNKPSKKFCSQRCRDWYDDGNAGYLQAQQADIYDLRRWRVVAGPPGTVGTNPWQSIIDASDRKRASFAKRKNRKAPPSSAWCANVNCGSSFKAAKGKLYCSVSCRVSMANQGSKPGHTPPNLTKCRRIKPCGQKTILDGLEHAHRNEGNALSASDPAVKALTNTIPADLSIPDFLRR